VELAKTHLVETTLKQILKLISLKPEKSISQIISALKIIIRDQEQLRILRNIQELVQDPTNNWHQYVVKLLTKTNPHIRSRLVNTFFINAVINGLPKQRRIEEKLGIGIPWAILIDPTEKCNLHCAGCWAGDYQRAHELDFSLLDRIFSEAKDLGTHFIIYSGGEPTVRKDDIFKLAEKHPDLAFMMFTNGTLIDQTFVDEMVRLGNVSVAFSIEGFEENTDLRRGAGVFRKVMNAMDLMRKAGVVFGVSVTYNNQNITELGSDEFVDMLVDKGTAFAWYFTYIPIGKDVDLGRMATPTQRAWMFERIRSMRQTKPIFLMDFWNDGDSCDGCIAGGRRYFHINANGDVEPCAFVHYSTCNIKDVSLKEALGNPLFQAYQKRQPFSENLLRPCPLIDNPKMMQDIVHESNARSTQLHADETADEFARKIAPYAKQWRLLSDDLWEKLNSTDESKPRTACK
jgi:MoaA/NifB/PqqE/SkfB family radical SAM enzyme